MRLSVLVGSRNRSAPLLRCLRSVLAQTLRPYEIVVLDDASDALVVADLLAREGHADLRVIRSPEPLGVGRGRNVLFREARGDAFLFLDDDAYLEDPVFLERLCGELAARSRAGIIAARIVDHQGGGTRLLVPFPRQSRREDPAIVERAQCVSYFLGGAHAVRREVYQRVGGYDESFVWGEEELDLSFRAINAGFEIHYVPHLTAHHQGEPPVLARAGKNGELFHHVRNRFVLARKYLPRRSAGPYLAVWLARHASDALRQGDPLSLVRGMVAGVGAAVTREALSPDALAYLRNHHGRLWY